jgi:hypothetical protein
MGTSSPASFHLASNYDRVASPWGEEALLKCPSVNAEDGTEAR